MGANAKKRREQADTTNLSRQQKIDAAAPKGGGANKIVLATALAILAIVAIVGAVIWNGSKEKGGDTAGSALPKGVSTAGGPIRAFPAVSVTDKTPTLDVYEDFQCPACQQFEGVLGSTVKKLAQEGKVKAQFHVMTFIDNNVHNDASTRATNGAMCAADQGKFEAFHDEVYANAPAHEGDGWTDEQLSGFAQKVGVDMNTWNTCVKDKKHQGYIDAVQTQTTKDGVTSTPTLKLNGKKMDLAGMTPEKFTKTIEDAAK